MRGLKKRGPLISEVLWGKIRIKRGESVGVIARGRVALIAQFSMGPDQPMSLPKYLEALEGNGYVTVVISIYDLAEPFRSPHRIPEATVVIRRPNFGYDFGSWAMALGYIPGARETPVVLLTNDLLLGPSAPIDHLLEWAVEPGPDIRGLTASYQFVRHIQSFFLTLCGRILANRPWVGPFNDVRVESDRDDVVLFYELGASKVCFSEAYSSDEWVTGPDLGVPYGNPAVDGWRKLMEYDIPFFKHTIMTHPSTLSEGTEVAAYATRRYSTGIAQW